MKHSSRQYGFSLLETMVALGLMSFLTVAMVKAFEMAQEGRENSERLSQRTQLLDLLSNMLRNNASWGNTIDKNQPIRNHLENASATAATTKSTLDLVDSEGTTFASASGSYLNSELNPTNKLVAKWFVKPEWTGRRGNLAEVEVTIEAVEKGQILPGHKRTIRSINRKVRDRCVSVRSTINTVSTHSRNGPFRYDKASAVCPANHTLISVTVDSGCGATWQRAHPDINQPNIGICYQISFPRSEWGTLGCDATNVIGQCEVKCCVFD